MKAAHLMTSVAILALAFSAAAWADPPERVGRISFTQGDVSVQPPERQDWLPASRNFPVTRDEAFWTEPGSLAQLQIGPVEAFMGSSTELQVDELDYGVLQMSLPEGAIHVELSRVPDGGVRIETPQGEIRLVEPGAYRIDAGAPDGNERDTVLVTSLSGRAEIVGPNVRVPVGRGETAEIDNGYRIAMSRGGPEPIDDFASRRLAEERYTAAPRYVSDEYSGYEDLGAYGDWEDTADYGPVWYPRGIAADWAPYRYGRWESVDPWGWTWIDDAPWGFTPFHYGRWTQVRGRWCWTPGEFARRPVYAPALVSFLGGGYGADISVGWVPLAPREVYRPWYGGYSTTYVRNINITNVDRTVVSRITVENIRNAGAGSYRNDHARTFVRQDDFSRSAPVQRAALKGQAPGVERAIEPMAIDKIRPAGGGFGQNGHAPRIDRRHVVMKPPASNVIPQQSTAPTGRSNAFSGRGDRGSPPSQRQTDTRPAVVTSDHRQPPPPPGRTFGAGGQQGAGQRYGEAHQPAVQSPATSDRHPEVRTFSPDNQQADSRRDAGAPHGRLSGAPNPSTQSIPGPVQAPQQPVASVASGRDGHRRGPPDWQRNQATAAPPPAANVQAPSVAPPPSVDRSFGGRGYRGDQSGQPAVQTGNPQWGHRGEPRQPTATPSPQPPQQPDQQHGRQGGGQHRQVSPQGGPAPAKAAAPDNSTQAQAQNDDQRGKHHRQDGRD